MRTASKRLLAIPPNADPACQPRRFFFTAWLACCLAALLAAGANLAAQTPQALKLDGDIEYSHDPSIAKDGDTWYLFGTANGPDRKGELPIRCSKDLHHWSLCGSVFEKIPTWITQQSPTTKELWAPDVSYFNGNFTSTTRFQFSARTLPESHFSPTRRSTRPAPIFIGSIMDSSCSLASKMISMPSIPIS